MPNTFAYLRVSSALQAANNGTDTQRHAITQWLTGQGIDPAGVRWFEDLAVSGKSMNRPQWSAMNKEIKGRDLVVCYSLSRAGRNLSGLSAWVHEMVDRDVRVMFVKEAVDVTTMNGRLVMHLLGAIEEWKREDIIEKTTDGIQSRIASGRGWGGQLLPPGTRGGPRFTAEEIASIRVDIAEGMTPWKLQKKYDADHRTIAKAIKG